MKLRNPFTTGTRTSALSDMPGQRQALPLIDLLKAISALLIVAHHLAFYGPMSDIAYQLQPALIDWLYEYARMAVQVFLATSGFLAARQLAPAGPPYPILHPFALMGLRWRRLALPMLAALLIGMACSAIARTWMTHPSIPAPPGLWQFISHALLLQHVLGQESLSAGVWYIAIDFQLYALLLLLLRFGRNMAPALICGFTAAALFYFNRDSRWDNWCVYFFASYAMGIAAAWIVNRTTRPWALLILALTVSALMLDYRIRLAVAFATASILALEGLTKFSCQWPTWRPIAWLSKTSYALFLIHFPVCLLVNTALYQLAPASPTLNLLGMVMALILSIGAGGVFYHWVEKPLASIRKKDASPTDSTHSIRT